MTLWALAASRRIISGTVQRSSTVAASAIGGTRQMSVADKDNILPVSKERPMVLFYMPFCCYYFDGTIQCYDNLSSVYFDIILP